METKNQFEKPLTIRERISLRVLFMVLKIVKSATSTYELDSLIREIELELKSKEV